MTIQTLPESMLAVRLKKYDSPYAVEKVPVPADLGPHDVLVKVAAASHCHTDGMVKAGDFKTSVPCIASHEGAGTVVKIGSEVEGMGIGTRVMGGLFYHPCNDCKDCLGPPERRQYCPNVESICGVTRDGFFAEYVVVDSRFTTVMPDAITFRSAAPLACAGRTIWRGVLQANLKAGETICLVGSGGGLGHLGIQFAKALGLNVIGIDARDDGLTLSEELGADVVLDARMGKGYLVEQVRKATGGDGAHATLTISAAPDAAALGCAVTMTHGTMVQIAQPENVSIPFAEIIFRDIRVRGSLLCSPQESNEMLATIAREGIVVKCNVFDGLEKIDELIELVHGGKIQGKAVIIVDKEQIEAEKSIGARY